MAAFLQAGLPPPKKLDHPSISGLIRKYTEVHVSYGQGDLCTAIVSPWARLIRFIWVLSTRSFRTKRYGSARMNGQIHKVMQ